MWSRGACNFASSALSQKKHLFAHPHRVENFFKMASRANGSSHKVRGPASALKNYLLRIGWSITNDGVLLTNTNLCYHITDTSWTCLNDTILQDWLRDFLVQNSSRAELRGIPTPSRKLTISALQAIAPHQRRGIVREFAQSYQTETQKPRWVTDTDGTCRFCPALDSKHHRHTSCPTMERIYSRHSEIVPCLKEADPMPHAL